MPSLLAIVCLLLVPSVVKATSNGGSLYFTNLNSIELLSNNLSTVVLGGLEHAESLDCNVCDQRIYWVDMLGKIKKGIPNNQSSIEVVIDKDLRHPIGLAVDWKGNNVYFSDTRNARGQGRIEVTLCNGRQRKVLLHNLGSPGPLALNLFTGYLYYIDEFNIKRISADGDGDPQVVYFEADAFDNVIKGLAVDVVNNLLYWTVGSNIKYLNMTHWETLTQTQRNHIVPEPVNKGFDGAVPHGISVINSTIYWTEHREVDQENFQITRPGAIYSLSIPTNTSRRLLQNDSLSPQDVSTFINISVHRDGCAINNGNCQHFCFTVPDGSGGTRPQCGCPTGIKLRADNRTCPEVPQEFLIFAQNFNHNWTEIRQISLDFPGKYIDTLVPIDNLGADISFLSYDLIFHQIYWAEVDPPAIKRAYVNGSNVETFIGTGLKHPEGIAVDSYSRNLYWVDSALNRIEVARLSDSKNRRVLFSDQLDHPQGLALDLDNEYMYWTDLDISEPKVERARMDGTGRMNLPNVAYTIKTPTNIAVDPLTGWVYWSETDSEVERVSRYDGSRDFSLSLRNTGDVFGLAIHGDYIYWTDRFLSSRALVRAQKSSGDGEEVILENYRGLLGLVAVNSSAEPVRTGCHLSYGNCEQLCLPSGSAHTCSCRDDFIINGNQCEDPAPHAYISSATIVAPFKVILTNSENWSRSLIGSPSFNITASAIDIDYRGSMLYWISSVDKQIYRQYVNLTSTSEPEPVVTCCLVTPEDLAVDWLGRNLYWTDSNRRVIEVAKLDGGGRTILAQIPKSFGSPSFIALDSTRGHLYWAPKSQAKIYKMRMNDSSPPDPELFWSAEHPTAEEKLIGIAINYEETPNDVIYWGTQTTNTTGALWRKELTGLQTARTIKVLNQKPLHVATFKYNVYYYYQRRGFGDLINSFNTQQQSDNQVVNRGSRGNIKDFTDFIVVHHSLQPGIHECSVLNHGCGGDETLCLVSNSLDGVCQCPANMFKQVHQDLAGQDIETCRSADSLLLIATQEAIHYLPIHTNISPGIPHPLPIGPLYDVSAVAYDPFNKSVLWIDRETQFLNRATVDGRWFWNIKKIANVSAFSMAYDWMGGQVFLTEEQGFQIELVTVNGEGLSSLLLHDVQQTRTLPRPGDVVFDVDTSTLYWTALSRNGDTIWNMSLSNTSNTRPLSIPGTRNINNLTLETLGKSLYWINSMNATIERYDLQTGQLRTIAEDAADVTALAAVPINNQPYVFWYNSSDRSIYRSNGQPMNYGVYQQWSGPSPIVDFVGSARSHPNMISFNCLASPGPRPCSHLCIQQPGNPNYMCSCPPNRRLNPNNGTCSDLVCDGAWSSCNDGFSCYPTSYYCDGSNYCRDGSDETCSCDTETERGCPRSHKCVPANSFCNGTIECPYGEDEELVPEGSCCPMGQFRCSVDGFLRCLHNDSVCDGMEDCDHGEDENEEQCPPPVTTAQTTPSTSATTMPPGTASPTSIQTPIIIATSTFFAALLIILFLFAICVSARCIRKKRGGYNTTQIDQNHLQMAFKPSSSPSENGSLYFSECGTHSTQLDLHGSNLSPSSFDSTSKRRSITALSTEPSVPPPSLITDRQSAFAMGDDRMSACSQGLSDYTPRVPNPSLNYSVDAMSSASFSVSQRNFPAAINGTDPHTHIHTHNHHFRRNPLLSQNHHHPYQQRNYHTHHFVSHPPHHLHHPHFVRQQRERLDTMSDTDSTISMTTLNTENFDLPPPGRPPTPATMTEFSGYHPHSLSPSSPVSEDSEQCSENFLHRD